MRRAGRRLRRGRRGDVHVHAFDPETGDQDDDPDRYARIVEGIRVELLGEEAPGAHRIVSGLGVDVTGPIPEAVERGGHVRVGVEDAPLGSSRGNVERVERARERIEAAGGSAASPAEVRAALDSGDG